MPQYLEVARILGIVFIGVKQYWISVSFGL